MGNAPRSTVGVTEHRWEIQIRGIHDIDRVNHPSGCDLRWCNDVDQVRDISLRYLAKSIQKRLVVNIFHI